MGKCIGKTQADNNATTTTAEKRLQYFCDYKAILSKSKIHQLPWHAAANRKCPIPWNSKRELLGNSYTITTMAKNERAKG